jgi:hypothetical protein
MDVEGALHASSHMIVLQQFCLAQMSTELCAFFDLFGGRC